MQLFLVNNDPLDTLLVSQDGHPAYLIRSSIESPYDLPDRFRLSESPESFSSSSGSSSSFSSLGLTSFPNSNLSPESSPSSIASVEIATSDPTSQHLGRRQRPTGLHAAIPITRIHSNPHPDAHKNWQDPSSPHPSPILPPSTPSSPLAAGSSRLVTNIKRLDRRSSSSGNTETQVARVEYSGDDVGTRVQLCHSGIELSAPVVLRKKRKSSNDDLRSASLTSSPAPSTSTPVSRTVTAVTRTNDAGTALDAFRDFCTESQKKKEPSTSSTNTGEPGWYDEQEAIPDPTWSFKGPDNRPYKWISLASNPILVNDTTPPTPIACYRPAKLGIVSRSRRGFLEILPEGLEKEDWIVATFAGYFRMKLGDRPPLLDARISDSSTADLPVGMNVGGSGVRKALSAPTTPAPSPLTQALGHPAPKMITASSALASLEALRRRNKNYGYGSARRTL